MTGQSNHLKYFLSETHYFERDYSILVVTLVGSLTEKNVPIFNQCIEQVSKSSAKWVIINFRDVPSGSDDTLIPSLRHMIDTVHKIPAGLRISGIHPQIRVKLESAEL